MGRIAGGHEGATEALKLEARRFVPGTARREESEGDFKLVVLLCYGHLFVAFPVGEDVRCLQISTLLSERCVLQPQLVLEYSNETV